MSISFTSCKKDSDGLLNEKQEIFIGNNKDAGKLLLRSINNPVDNDFNNFALVVSEALNEDENFRSMLKNEALLRYDGANDILLRSFKDSVISVGQINTSIADYLNGYYSILELSVTQPLGSTNNSHVDNLVKKYPDIQISIPEKLDNWNREYNPVVVFVPSDANEGETKYLYGYQDGNILLVDANTPPDDPVIVIGHNERPSINPDSEPLDFTIDLELSTFESGIKLFWTISEEQAFIGGYYIYRKESGNNGPFVHIATNDEEENRIYYDNSVSPNKNYSYYVKAFDYSEEGTSPQSNIKSITSPDVAASLAKFNAIHQTYDDIELRWNHASGQYVDHTNLYKRVPSIDDEYQLIGSFPINTYDYIDNSVIHGEKVVYKIEDYVDNDNHSAPKYDFVHVPFRDISQPGELRISHSSYDYSHRTDLEGWWNGPPEFKITVVKGGSDTTAATIQKELWLYYKVALEPYYMGEHPFDVFVTDWLPDNWMEIINFTVVENDHGPNVDLNMNIKYNSKDTINHLLVTGGLSYSLEDLYNVKDEWVGTGLLYYRDPLVTDVYCGNYNFNLTLVSEH